MEANVNRREQFWRCENPPTQSWEIRPSSLSSSTTLCPSDPCVLIPTRLRSRPLLRWNRLYLKQAWGTSSWNCIGIMHLE